MRYRSGHWCRRGERALSPAPYQFVNRAAKVSYRKSPSGALGALRADCGHAATYAPVCFAAIRVPHRRKAAVSPEGSSALEVEKTD